MPSIRSIVHGLGGLGAVVVVFLGFRGLEVNPYLALLCLAVILWALMDWLWSLKVNPRLKIIGSVIISASCIAAWFTTEPPPPARWIRSPFKLTNAVITTISERVACTWCRDEIVLDDVGILFPTEAGRGFIVIAFSDTPTLELKDPKPGKVALPKSLRSRPTNEPSISIDWFEVPPGIKGILKIRKPQEEFRFEVADKRSHLIKTGNRSFLVTLVGTVSEEPTRDGQHTIFTYGFTVTEQ